MSTLSLLKYRIYVTIFHFYAHIQLHLSYDLIEMGTLVFLLVFKGKLMQI